MYSKVFFSNKKLMIYSSSFLLGIFLSFSFEPFNLPFMSVIAVGMFFLVNDYIYQNLQNKKKIFFLQGYFLGLDFSYLVLIGFQIQFYNLMQIYIT